MKERSLSLSSDQEHLTLLLQYDLLRMALCTIIPKKKKKSKMLKQKMKAICFYFIKKTTLLKSPIIATKMFSQTVAYVLSLRSHFKSSHFKNFDNAYSEKVSFFLFQGKH